MHLLNMVNKDDFIVEALCCKTQNTYICNVFFMVLDLRLTMKIGCRETTFPFLYTFLQSYTSFKISVIESIIVFLHPKEHLI